MLIFDKMVGSVHRSLPDSFHTPFLDSNSSSASITPRYKTRVNQNVSICEKKIGLYIPKPKRNIKIKFRIQDIKEILCEYNLEEDLIFSFDDL